MYQPSSAWVKLWGIISDKCASVDNVLPHINGQLILEVSIIAISATH